MLFAVPGIEKVVRIRGTASIHVDDASRSECLDGSAVPKLVIKVAIDTLLFHCPKALMKAGLWNQDAYQAREFLPSLLNIIKDQQVEKHSR